MRTLAALYGLLLRTQVTLPRLLGIGALGALAVVLGALARLDEAAAEVAGHVLAAYGLGVALPLAALWVGTAALGGLAEDHLLVYLRLKPVPRWQLPAAAVLATATLVAPLTAVPFAVAAGAAGAWELAPAAAGAALLGSCAYAGLFVAVGLWFRRAVWIGLAFVLLWEHAAANASNGTARFTVAAWARAVLSAAPDVDVPLDERSLAAALVVLPALAVLGWLAATWRYATADVD
jgi:hypothetical protein